MYTCIELLSCMLYRASAPGPALPAVTYVLIISDGSLLFESALNAALCL